MNTTSIILKTDKRGHVRTPPERREELLAEFDRSGLTLTRFAELAGVRYSTFATWLQQRRNKRAASQDKEKVTPKPVRFAEVLMDGTLQPVPSVACALAVSLPGGAHLVLTEASQVPLAAQLIAALNPSSPC
jgi:predicted HTH domain antitoxin